MSELQVMTQSGVRTLTLNRPERLNAINDALSSKLIEALQQASIDDEVRVVVITGEGRGFCTGLDLSTARSLSDPSQSRHEKLDDLGWVGHLALAIVNCDKPVLAAINGTAAGAGLAITLACDLRLMSDHAKLTTGYIRRALSPDAGVTYFLPRLIGTTRATELILTGRDVGAEEAEKIGLVNRIYPSESFLDDVLLFATELAAGPPIALTLTKRLLVTSTETDLLSQLKQEFRSIKTCFGTEDVQEGIKSFQEKRKPQFRGK